MNLEDKNRSLQFYNYLCNIVGSEEVVRTRRDIFTYKDIVENTSYVTSISSGSKAEGLDLKGSDYDRMYQLNCIRVYESVNDAEYDPYNVILVMETNDTKPGFTKIKLVDKSYLDVEMIYHCCETLGEEMYISSKKVRERNLSDNMIIHGPCQSTPGGEYDSADCYRCKEWVTPAQQWIHRSRTAWPYDPIINSAVEYGVLFVPIGCKDSPNEDLQWRISFSLTEKLLIHSFNHTQLLCYALMKIILKDLIKPKHGDLLCSYFLKTIMFWLSEEKGPSEWKPENITSCFLDCIRRLIYCVEYKTCLHYFIPENNLFEDRFTDKEHQQLLITLGIIYKSPWYSVFETSTFQNYRLESINSHGKVLCASELSCYNYLKSFYTCYIAIQRLVNVNLNEELCTYMLSIYAKQELQSSPLCNMMIRHKSFYQQYKTSFCYFKMSLRSFSLSSWLMLASFFYKCRRFQECLVIINYCLFSCTPDKIFHRYGNSFAEQTVFNQMKHKYGLLHAFKYLMFDNIFFLYPFYLLPDELISLIVGDACVIPPVLYSYLLQFLCCYQLGNYWGELNALHNLGQTVEKQYLIFPLKNTFRTVHEILEIVRQLLR